MMLIFGLMLLLLQTAACLEVNCSFNQSDPCNAALGDKLNLLMVDASIYDLQLKKRINDNTADGPVCRIKNDTMKSDCNLYNNRVEVTVINGTLIINHVIRADSGNYTLSLFDSIGTQTSEKHLQVIVEAPSIALIVLGCFAVILIILVAIAYYIYKKRNRLKTTADTECTSTDAQTNMSEKKEQELHYEEITFGSSNVKQQPRKTQEECVYAQVQMH